MADFIIATDAWHPQINGVVRTLENTIQRLNGDVIIVHPGLFKTFKLPFYKDISLAYGISQKSLAEKIDSLINSQTSIHIATEGPVGWAMRKYCLQHKYKFTTSYHTNFPEYIRGLCGVPPFLTYKVLTRFHQPASRVMVSTDRMADILKKHGFQNEISIWSRGVDTEQFVYKPKERRLHPTCIYVGRVSGEKNLHDFLNISFPCRKIVVGDGPLLKSLKSKYKDVDFRGFLTGQKLIDAYNEAEIFVFPSKSDTFGLVIIEALACGLTVAAYPVQGPLDILREPAGFMDKDLNFAVIRAYEEGEPEQAVMLAQEFSWKNCTDQFVSNLVNING